VGVIPAFFTLWIQKRVREPEIWKAGRAAAPSVRAGFGEIFGKKRLRITLLVTMMNACTMFAWWGFNLWLPAYLSMAPHQGGIGLSPRTMSGLVIFMQVGMWLGYITFGFISDKLGRKRSYVGFLLAAAAFMLLYSQTRRPLLLLILGPFVAFFGTGYFTGFGALTAEIYPTAVRATAQGITYNTGRIVSAAAPFVVGSLAQTKGFGFSFLMISAAFLTAAAFWVGIPETKGKELD
jgi:MFS family permease